MSSRRKEALYLGSCCLPAFSLCSINIVPAYTLGRLLGWHKSLVPAVCRVYIVLGSPISVGYMTHLVQVSLVGSVNTGPMDVFDFLGGARQLATDSHAGSSAAGSPLSVFYSVDSAGLSVGLQSLKSVSKATNYTSYSNSILFSSLSSPSTSANESSKATTVLVYVELSQ